MDAMKYPCFKSYNPNASFCVMKCEFAGECEPATPDFAKQEVGGKEVMVSEKAETFIEELEKTDIDDLLEKLASVEDVKVLQEVCDNYKIVYEEEDDLNALMIMIDSYFENRSSGDDDDKTESKPEEFVQEEEEEEAKEVKESPAKNEEEEMYDETGGENLSKIEQEYLKLGTTMANSISDNIVSSSDILKHAPPKALGAIKEAVDSIMLLETNVRTEAEEISPVEEETSEDDQDKGVNKFFSLLEKLGLVPSSNTAKTRHYPRIKKPFVLLSYNKKRDIWFMGLMEADLTEYPECIQMRGKPSIDVMDERAEEIFFRHAKVHGYSPEDLNK